MEEVNGKWEMYEMVQALLQAPMYHLMLDALLILLVTYLLFRKSYNPKERTRLTEKEKEELIQDWQPEPLVPPVDPNHPALHTRVVEGRIGKYVVVDGKKCLNMATQNYLGFADSKEMEDAALESLRKYGVGSCGPRAFYGTVDVHIELEKRLADFIGVECGLLYSYGFSTVASAIPAYAKKGDIIFADEAVSFSIQKGLQASRSTIRYFKHNDVADLERLLEKQRMDDIANPKQAKVTRRFLVVEGIYFNTGDACPLPQIVELKNKHKVRLFVDDSVGFGVLGEHGRGIMEHYGISPDEVDCLSATLEYAIGSSGGFCVGTEYVIHHQVLSALGYCFSASLPPMLASAAARALDIMEREPEIFVKLRSNAKLVDQLLRTIPGVTIGGIPESPVKHVRLTEPELEREDAETQLEDIVKMAYQDGIAFTVARYLVGEEQFLPQPSIRVTVSSSLDETEIRNAVQVLKNACAKIL